MAEEHHYLVGVRTPRADPNTGVSNPWHTCQSMAHTIWPWLWAAAAGHGPQAAHSGQRGGGEPCCKQPRCHSRQPLPRLDVADSCKSASDCTGVRSPGSVHCHVCLRYHHGNGPGLHSIARGCVTTKPGTPMGRQEGSRADGRWGGDGFPFSLG